MNEYFMFTIGRISEGFDLTLTTIATRATRATRATLLMRINL
jgi:hypothetical protein